MTTNRSVDQLLLNAREALQAGIPADASLEERYRTLQENAKVIQKQQESWKKATLAQMQAEHEAVMAQLRRRAQESAAMEATLKEEWNESMEAIAKKYPEYASILREYKR